MVKELAPCAPWCITQADSAKCRSMLHNVFVYQCSGAQSRSHRSRHTHRWVQFYYLICIGVMKDLIKVVKCLFPLAWKAGIWNPFIFFFLWRCHIQKCLFVEKGRLKWQAYFLTTFAWVAWLSIIKENSWITVSLSTYLSCNQQRMCWSFDCL